VLNREYAGLFIDGEWRAPHSQERFVIVSPTTEEPIGSVPSAAAADVDAAVEAARRAFHESTWATRPVAERANMCRRLAELIAACRSEFTELVIDELACDSGTAEYYQALAPSLYLNYYADLGEAFVFSEVNSNDPTSHAGEGLGSMYAGRHLLVKEPVGVVAAIFAYNFPLPSFGQKVAGALIAGCTVVVKAPEPDPLAVFALGDLITEAGFPPGVINLIAAGPAASEHLVSHPDVDLVTFTGSDAVGAKVAEICGRLVRPVVLELGGKSAGIVLEDADLDQAISHMVISSVGTMSGQNCACISRILAPRSRYNEVASRLAEAISALVVGDPHSSRTQVGPLITEKHRARVLSLIDSARDEGARVLVGGGIPQDQPRGWFVEPTLITDVTNGMRIAQEEVFGPVTVLIPYDDEAEAVRLANDSRYGLYGAVYTINPDRGFEIARQIRVGSFSVNTSAVDFTAPFGGLKRSGYGREHGLAGLEGYLVTKAISIDPASEVPTSALS
jgi:aldehyde dehydrogenase (NAD+)